MPRKPRNSPRPAGRPRKLSPGAEAALAAGVATPEDVAAAEGVSRSTAYAAASRASQGAAPAPAPTAPPAVTRGAASPPATDRRSALLALLAQALDAEPALVDALPLDAVELGRRLADPGQDEPIPPEALEDPARLLRWVAEFVARDLRRLKPGQAAARKQAAGLLVTLASGQDRIQRSRPIGETPEQIVQRRLVESRDAAIDRIGILTAEEAARLAAARAELAAWATGNLGPVLGPEVARRVDLLFGEASGTLAGAA